MNQTLLLLSWSCQELQWSGNNNKLATTYYIYPSEIDYWRINMYGGDLILSIGCWLVEAAMNVSLQSIVK